MLNESVVTLSITILIVICIVLIVLVFVLSNAFRNLQLKMRDREVRVKNGVMQKHYLTGLENRIALIAKLQALFKKSSRKKINTAMLFIDLDDFNSLNLSVGPQVADLLLQKVSQKIVQKMTEYSRYIYQIGSDEFAVIIYDYGPDADVLKQIAQDLIQFVSTPVTVDDYDLEVSCCIGICVYPECAQNAEELLKHSGSARDHAKAIGHGSYSVYTKEMSKHSILRSLISADLRHALQRNELVLHYQPKVNSLTGKVEGAEALLRWQHPSFGNISPDVFIPVMEDLGLIHPIGKWVFNTALRDMSKLHKKGFDNLTIAINVSPQQFNKGDVAGLIAESIWETGIAPYKVELELTEALVMKDTEKTLLMLKVLQSMGVNVAVDDFGTGYSSMNHLTRFPINILKIDRTFVHDMDTIPVKRAIVTAIISMARELGFEVVAEGVETEGELNALRQDGCVLIQGFYYSKALPFEEFQNYVIAKNAAGAMPVDFIAS